MARFVSDACRQHRISEATLVGFERDVVGALRLALESEGEPADSDAAHTRVGELLLNNFHIWVVSQAIRLLRIAAEYSESRDVSLYSGAETRQALELLPVSLHMGYLASQAWAQIGPLTAIRWSDRSRLAKAAANKRQSGNRALRKVALALASQGDYPSRRQAAIRIESEVQRYARSNGIAPLSAENAQRTIYEWLLKAK